MSAHSISAISQGKKQMLAEAGDLPAAPKAVAEPGRGALPAEALTLPCCGSKHMEGIGCLQALTPRSLGTLRPYPPVARVTFGTARGHSHEERPGRTCRQSHRLDLLHVSRVWTFCCSEHRMPTVFCLDLP